MGGVRSGGVLGSILTLRRRNVSKITLSDICRCPHIQHLLSTTPFHVLSVELLILSYLCRRFLQKMHLTAYNSSICNLHSTTHAHTFSAMCFRHFARPFAPQHIHNIDKNTPFVPHQNCKPLLSHSFLLLSFSAIQILAPQFNTIFNSPDATYKDSKTYPQCYKQKNK